MIRASESSLPGYLPRPALVVSTTSWQWCLWCHRRLQKPAQITKQPDLVSCTSLSQDGKNMKESSESMLDMVQLCWSMLLVYANPIFWALTPWTQDIRRAGRCTSRRDFLRVSTLILSLRLFTYLMSDPKGIGQARLEPKLQSMTGNASSHVD